MKDNKHFDLNIPFSKTEKVEGRDRVIHICDINFCGVATRYGNDFEYDIDQVFVGAKQIPLEVFEALHYELKENDEIHNAIMAHLPSLWESEDTTTDILQDCVDIVHMANRMRA